MDSGGGHRFCHRPELTLSIFFILFSLLLQLVSHSSPISEQGSSGDSKTLTRACHSVPSTSSTLSSIMALGRGHHADTRGRSYISSSLHYSMLISAQGLNSPPRSNGRGPAPGFFHPHFPRTMYRRMSPGSSWNYYHFIVVVCIGARVSNHTDLLLSPSPDLVYIDKSPLYFHDSTVVRCFSLARTKSYRCSFSVSPRSTSIHISMGYVLSSGRPTWMMASVGFHASLIGPLYRIFLPIPERIYHRRSMVTALYWPEGLSYNIYFRHKAAVYIEGTTHSIGYSPILASHGTILSLLENDGLTLPEERRLEEATLELWVKTLNSELGLLANNNKEKYSTDGPLDPLSLWRKVVEVCLWKLIKFYLFFKECVLFGSSKSPLSILIDFNFLHICRQSPWLEDPCRLNPNLY